LACVITLHVTDRDGQARTRQCDTGQSLMRALRRLDYDVQAICGGVASCATCHVYVDAAWRGRLAPPAADEVELIVDTEAYVEGASRLSCQVPLTEALDGLTVTLAPEE